MTTNNVNNRALSAPLTPPRTAVMPAAGEGLVEATASVTAARPQEASKPRGLFGHLADVFIGGGEAIGDMVKGIATVITHPIQTLKGIGYVITHPSALVHAFVEPYKEAIREGRPGKAIGRGIVEIGSLFVGPAEIANGVKGATNAIKGIFKGGQAGGVIGAGAAGAAGAVAAVNITEKAAKTASGLIKAAEKSAQRADVLAKAGKAAEAANLVAYAGFLDEASKAIQTGADAAEIMARVRYVSTGGNVAAATGTLAKGASVLAATADGAVISAMMPAIKGADAVLKGTAAVDDLAKAGNVAAKAGQKVVVSTQPILTKTAIKELAKVGIKDSKAITGALDEAAKIYQAQKAAGATTTAAKNAAQASAAAKLGLEAGSTAVEKLVNGVRLQGAAANPANYFTRTNYVRNPLHKAAEIIGKPIDIGIVAAREAGEQAAVIAGKAGETLARGVQRVGDITLRELIVAPITLPIQAVKGAGRIISNGLAAISDLPLREILTAPIRGIGNAIGAGSQALGKIGELTLKDLILAPAHLANLAMTNPAALYRPAVTMGLLGRLGDAADTKGSNADLAQRFGLDSSAANIEAFKSEVAGYGESAIGPDSGTPEQIGQLQTVLRGLGYDVKATGKFDEATALAVIDFKEKNDITQSYKLANGRPAINEYVDEATARVMVDALKARKGGQEAASFDSKSLQASLAAFDGALEGLSGAKTESAKANAVKGLDQAAVTVIADLVRKARTGEKGSAEAGTQMDKIAEQLTKAGYSDDRIFELIEAAKVLADRPAETDASEKPAASKELDIAAVSRSYQANADALSKALDSLGSAKTDAEKAKAKKAVEAAAVDAITDLSKLAHSDDEGVLKTVSEEMGGLADALSDAGYSEDAIMKLVEQGRVKAKAALMPAAKPDVDSRDATASEIEAVKPIAVGEPDPTSRPTEGPNAGSRPRPAVPSEPAVYYTAKRGDSLSSIAKQELGDASRWREIYDLNKQAVGPNPNLILPGQKLLLPATGESADRPELPPTGETPATEPPKGETPATEPPSDTGKPGSLTEAQIKDLVKQHKILDEPANVKAFVAEISGYRDSAIGPDAGTPEVIRQLQTVLARVGYAVEPTGKFDDATADAIIDFKQKNDLSQSYKLADGTWAINEYVDDKTAKAIVDALPKGGAKATPIEIVKPAKPAEPAETPKDEAAKPSEPAVPAKPSEPAKPAEPATPASKTYAVKRGDSLSAIAQRELGDAGRWREIYDLNKQAIGPNPNMIRPGQSINLPG